MKSIDPSRLAPTDRLAELGEILAAGIQRYLAREIKPDMAPIAPTIAREQLDAAAAVEAQCGSPIEVPA